jgi:hypothetical protein
MESAVRAVAVLLLIAVSVPCAAVEVVSVLDLEHSGIAEQEMTLFVDYLTSGIVTQGGYEVVDRARRQQILQEIEFSNADCTDESCQIEIGQEVSADRALSTQVMKMGTVTVSPGWTRNRAVTVPVSVNAPSLACTVNEYCAGVPSSSDEAFTAINPLELSIAKALLVLPAVIEYVSVSWSGSVPVTTPTPIALAAFLYISKA